MLPEPLRIGSLFSGIGGLELGLERGLAAAGVPTRTLWQVEQNPYARAVLARHWPHAERFEDVRDITAATVAPVDLLCGGFPCQDISTAGKGAGLAGEQSGLFFEMARIIRELVPRVVVLENVPAITSRGLDAVLGALASCRYAAKWGMLRADDPLVGAPHRRERWFCVAWLADHDRQRSEARARLPAGAGSDLSDPDRGDWGGSGMADTDSRRRDWWTDHAGRDHRPGQDARRAQGDNRNSRNGEALADTRRGDIQLQRKPGELGQAQAAAPQQRAGAIGGGQARHDRQTEPDMGGGLNGLSRKLDAYRWPAPPGPQHPWEPPRTRPREKHDRDRLKALGNAVVPACAEIIGRWIGSELVGLR